MIHNVFIVNIFILKPPSFIFIIYPSASWNCYSFQGRLNEVMSRIRMHSQSSSAGATTSADSTLMMDPIFTEEVNEVCTYLHMFIVSMVIMAPVLLGRA